MHNCIFFLFAGFGSSGWFKRRVLVPGSRWACLSLCCLLSAGCSFRKMVQILSFCFPLQCTRLNRSLRVARPFFDYDRRTVVSIPNGPSALAVKEAAWGLARYAAISQVIFYRKYDRISRSTFSSLDGFRSCETLVFDYVGQWVGANRGAGDSA